MTTPPTGSDSGPSGPARQTSSGGSLVHILRSLPILVRHFPSTDDKEPVNTDIREGDQSTVVLEVQITDKELQSAINEGVRHLARRTRIPGFRPGKAPRAMIERARSTVIVVCSGAGASSSRVQPSSKGARASDSKRPWICESAPR